MTLRIRWGYKPFLFAFISCFFTGVFTDWCWRDMLLGFVGGLLFIPVCALVTVFMCGLRLKD